MNDQDVRALFDTASRDALLPPDLAATVRRRAATRSRVLRGGLGASVVALVVALAYFGPHAKEPNRVTERPGQTDAAAVISTDTATPVPPLSSTGTHAPGTYSRDPTLAIWPWAREGDIDRGSNEQMDPRLLAQGFVTEFGGKIGSSVHAGQPFTQDGETIVPVSRLLANGETIEVGLVHLHQWAYGAMSVTRVSAAERGFTNLRAGATLQSGQEIRGKRHHPDGQYTISVYASRGVQASGGAKPLGTGRSATISDTEWSTKVDYAPPAATAAPQITTGFVIATEASLADGGLRAIIAAPVALAVGA